MAENTWFSWGYNMLQHLLLNDHFFSSHHVSLTSHGFDESDRGYTQRYAHDASSTTGCDSWCGSGGLKVGKLRSKKIPKIRLMEEFRRKPPGMVLKPSQLMG